MAGNERVFDGCMIYIIPKSMGPKRLQLFKDQVMKNGGRICVNDDWKTSLLSHVVYDEGLSPDDPEIKNFLELGDTVKLVGTKWLSECIKSQKLAPLDHFELKISHQKVKSGEDNEMKLNEAESPPKKVKVVQEITINHQTLDTQQSLNSSLIAELGKLAKSYRSLGDVYRSRNYFSAVSVIEKYPKQIQSYEEALTINGITARMASKIGEILETGSLGKANELVHNEKVKVVEIFTQIWGVGPATADNWFRQGYRTLEDVKSKCNLNKMQQIGVKYFDDFLKPIPRQEMEEIHVKVSQTAKSIDPTIRTEICGSYRRGKLLCGDIDIVIFEHNEDHSQLMEKLLKILTGSGFVSDEFASLEKAKHHKFLGICKLHGQDNVFRRLDIFIVPFKEYAPAMIHYTGSANFNIALRQYAIKKGMHLSENGLFDKVVRQGTSVVTGDPLHTPTEESVFHLLGLPYTKPEDRLSLVIKGPD